LKKFEKKRAGKGNNNNKKYMPPETKAKAMDKNVSKRKILVR